MSPSSSSTQAVRITDDCFRHPECYTCTECGLNLKMRGHFWVEDKMFCEKHARERYQGPGTNNRYVVSPNHWDADQPPSWRHLQLLWLAVSIERRRCWCHCYVVQWEPNRAFGVMSLEALGPGTIVSSPSIIIHPLNRDYTLWSNGFGRGRLC